LTVNVVPLGEGWYGASVGGSRNLPETFIVEVEEGSIPEDGTADAAAILILAQFGLVAGGLEEVAGVEDVVAEVLVGRSMELVRSSAGDDVDDTAGRTSCLCSVAVGLDRDLLNTFDVRLDADGADDTFVVVDSIDYPVV
jgi:hypothetical protein